MNEANFKYESGFLNERRKPNKKLILTRYFLFEKSLQIHKGKKIILKLKNTL